MSRSTAVRPYRWLAQHYDRMFGPLRAPLDAARRRILFQELEEVESACDLACGTGTTAKELVLAGKKVYAVDQSSTMCSLAKAKAGEAIKVICADMRTFRLPEKVDLVLCEGDALNHVPIKSDLNKVLSAVARALKPGGRFYFDVNNRAGFKRYWTGTVWMEKPGIVLVMRNGNDHIHDRAWCDVEWFIREGKAWQRRRERVEEVCWSDHEIRSSLRDAGFARTHSWDAEPFFRGSESICRGCRTIYLARKGAA